MSKKSIVQVIDSAGNELRWERHIHAVLGSGMLCVYEVDTDNPPVAIFNSDKWNCVFAGETDDE